jgi:pimeloyl-ACP methyl ester carboxylesterase
VLTAFGSLDTVTLPAEPAVQMFFKGAAGHPHRIIEGAGHFIQEHAPKECEQAILDLLGRTG